MTSQNNLEAREKDIVIQELKGEVLIYDLIINKAYCLNPTAAAVWNLCDGSHSVADIARALSQKMKQPVTDDLVWLALDQFKADNLLADNQEVEIKFGGLSRREVIRKVGFASLVALPVIVSLVAPTAAMAQSGGNRAIAASCTADSQCASGNCADLGTAAATCCTAGGNDRRQSGDITGRGGDAGDCATYTCDPTQTARCCSGSATLTSCSSSPGRPGIVDFECTCD